MTNTMHEYRSVIGRTITIIGLIIIYFGLTVIVLMRLLNSPITPLGG